MQPRQRLAAALFCVLVGCGTLQGDSDTTSGSGRLYVGSTGGNSVARFDEATTLGGNIQPQVTVSGSSTGLNSPGYLFYNASADRMWIPNSGNNSVRFWEGWSGLSANSPPARILAGANTRLNRPVQVEYDASNDLLYVANSGDSSVLVFANASTINGEVAPTRQLAGSSTQISGLSSLHLDTANNRLYLANSAGNSITVYDNASGLNGNVPPTRIISGGNTRLAAPQYLLFQGGTMWVAGTSTLLRFDSVDSVTGNTAPTSFATPPDLSRPQQFDIRSNENELYVVDASQGVLVYANASTLSGAPSPTRRLTGSSTGLTTAKGMALDFNHDPSPTSTSTSTTSGGSVTTSSSLSTAATTSVSGINSLTGSPTLTSTVTPVTTSFTATTTQNPVSQTTTNVGSI